MTDFSAYLILQWAILKKHYRIFIIDVTQIIPINSVLMTSQSYLGNILQSIIHFLARAIPLILIMPLKIVYFLCAKKIIKNAMTLKIDQDLLTKYDFNKLYRYEKYFLLNKIMDYPQYFNSEYLANKYIQNFFLSLIQNKTRNSLFDGLVEDLVIKIKKSKCNHTFYEAELNNNSVLVLLFKKLNNYGECHIDGIKYNQIMKDILANVNRNELLGLRFNYKKEIEQIDLLYKLCCENLLVGNSEALIKLLYHNGFDYNVEYKNKEIFEGYKKYCSSDKFTLIDFLLLTSFDISLKISKFLIKSGARPTIDVEKYIQALMRDENFNLFLFNCSENYSEIKQYLYVEQAKISLEKTIPLVNSGKRVHNTKIIGKI